MATANQSESPVVRWTGKSGTVYRYWAYSLPHSFDANQPGNYIYTKKDAQGRWQPIYIGQGDLNDRANNHHQAQCIRLKGATHFYCHKNGVEKQREEEEADLLANYSQAYAPTGCNEKGGG